MALNIYANLLLIKEFQNKIKVFLKNDNTT